MTLLGKFSRESFVTVITIQILSLLVFLLLVSLKDALAGEVLPTQRADLPLTEVLGPDVSLQAVVGTKLSPTVLAHQTGPGVFVSLVSGQVPLALT